MKFWNWTPKTDDTEERELVIDGAISDESWFDDDVTPKQFREELENGNGDITLWINSPGGDVFAASQIYTMLRDYPGKVTVKIDGLAASAASVIAMAGTSVLMSPTALLMIHDPATCAFGNEEDMKQAIEVLREVKESIINAYEEKTHLQRAHIDRLMSAETWMNAKKAIELGFADGLIEDECKKKTTNATPLSFEAKISEAEMVRRAVARASLKDKPEVKDEEPQAIQTTGRRIDDLMCELLKKAH